MKKLAMLAAVLLGTAAASQAGIDIHIGLPLPRVIIGHPPAVVVAPRPCVPPVVVAPPCGPVYGYRYGYYSHRHGCNNGCWHQHRSYGYDHRHGRR